MAKAANHGLGLACFAVMVAMTGAAQFKVGGDNGWSVPGANAESYNTWAERTRFHIGDSLVFVYPKDKDSVLLVEPGDYNACNTSSYVRKFDDGNTVFTFDRSGAFFFISGVEANCRANEKLIVLVLAGRNGTGGGAAAFVLIPASEHAARPSSSVKHASAVVSSSDCFQGAAGDVPTPPAPAPKAPTSAPPPASAPTTPPPSSPPAPTGSPPAPPSANAPSAGGTPPPAGSRQRNGAGLTVAAGIVSSAGACIIGYAMLAL